MHWFSTLHSTVFTVYIEITICIDPKGLLNFLLDDGEDDDGEDDDDDLFLPLNSFLGPTVTSSSHTKPVSISSFLPGSAASTRRHLNDVKRLYRKVLSREKSEIKSLSISHIFVDWSSAIKLFYHSQCFQSVFSISQRDFIESLRLSLTLSRC